MELKIMQKTYDLALYLYPAPAGRD